MATKCSEGGERGRWCECGARGEGRCPRESIRPHVQPFAPAWAEEVGFRAALSGGAGATKAGLSAEAFVSAGAAVPAKALVSETAVPAKAAFSANAAAFTAASRQTDVGTAFCDAARTADAGMSAASKSSHCRSPGPFAKHEFPGCPRALSCDRTRSLKHRFPRRRRAPSPSVARMAERRSTGRLCARCSCPRF
jgi:hypothetical protein